MGRTAVHEHGREQAIILTHGNGRVDLGKVHHQLGEEGRLDDEHENVDTEDDMGYVQALRR